MHDLTNAEWALLTWLSNEDSSPYGTCFGQDLDSLVDKGLAEIGKAPEAERLKHYRPVYLTDAGNELARKAREHKHGNA